ncbi:MAG TPA: sulfatase, partial [Planctomycetaceae bacterium]|nr:sulfatase [Planctomycetaceae bacterium]
MHLIVAWGWSQSEAADRPLNIVIVLVDDMGWTDCGCFGSDLYQTPHIDQLAREGMLFRQAYSACTVCSPTRAALLTGKYPARLHVTDWIPGLVPDNPRLLVPEWTKHLPLEEVALAEVFRQAGYATASIGKWHLGGEPYYPEHHGFDINVAGTDKAAPPSYFAPWKIPTLNEGRPGESLTNRIGAEAVEFIRRSRGRPFFLYVPHFAVHKPIQGRPDLVRKYQARPRGDRKHRNAEYAAMVENMDETVGQIRQALRDEQVEDRTAIIFTSDNGGHIPSTSNAPLRAGKASAYEGGVRVPLIIHWPGVTRAGRVCEVPVMTIDFYPTLLEMAGLPGAAEHVPDGVSLVDVLMGADALPRDALYWHYPHHQHYQQQGAMPYGAIRSGDHRLIEFYDDEHVELFDLRHDIGEAHDLAAENP